MLCCIAEIGAFVFGMIALVSGKFKLSRTKVVQGAPARIIGVVLLMPIVLGQGGSIIYGFFVGARKGAAVAAQGKTLTPADVEEMKKELETPLIVFNLVVGGISLVAALGIALATAQAPARPRRRDEDYDEDDDEDRRPRRSRDDEDDDIPRRRRGIDDDDDRDEERVRPDR